MQTVALAEPTVKAFYCTVYDQDAIIGKIDGRIYQFGTDGSVTDFEPEMAPWVCILGRTDLADTQRLMDLMHGGAAGIALNRQMEVA
jgi:hypothetical protein